MLYIATTSSKQGSFLVAQLPSLGTLLLTDLIETVMVVEFYSM